MEHGLMKYFHSPENIDFALYDPRADYKWSMQKISFVLKVVVVKCMGGGEVAEFPLWWINSGGSSGGMEVRVKKKGRSSWRGRSC